MKQSADLLPLFGQFVEKLDGPRGLFCEELNAAGAKQFFGFRANA